MTTTKNIETRVKRQVVLEDGKVVQDSGPIVETNTTEDTDTQESETVEVNYSNFGPVFVMLIFIFVIFFSFTLATKCWRR